MINKNIPALLFFVLISVCPLYAAEISEKIDTGKPANADTIADTTANAEVAAAAEAGLKAKADKTAGTIRNAELLSGFLSQAGEFITKGSYISAAIEFEKAANLTKNSRKLETAVNYSIDAGYNYYKAGAYSKAIENYKRALEIDALYERSDNIALDLGYIGQVYHVWGYYREALKFYQDALLLDKKLGVNERVGFDYSNIGRLLFLIGRHDEAIKTYEKGLDIFKVLRNNQEIAVILSELGITYYKDASLKKTDEFKKETYKKALEYFENALDINVNLMRESYIADNLFDMGTVYYAIGQYVEAFESYEDALEINMRLRRDSKAVDSLEGLGLAAMMTGEYKRAIKSFQVVLAFHVKQEKMASIADDYHNLAIAYESDGEYAKALDAFLDASDINRSLKREKLLARDLRHLSLSYLDLKDADLSLESCMEALKIDRKFNVLENMAVDFDNCGDSYKIKGLVDKSVGMYKKSLAVYKQLDKKKHISDILNNIGNLYMNAGQFNRSAIYYKDALEIDEKLKNEVDISRDLNNLGMVYYYRGDDKKSLKFFQKALDIDRRIGSSDNIVSDLNNIGLMLYKYGDYKSSVKYIGESVDLTSQLRYGSAGELRKNYLESELELYQFLISAYTNLDDSDSSIVMQEARRSALLSERINVDEYDVVLKEGIASLQEKMPPEEAMLLFSNTSWDQMVHMVLTDSDFGQIEKNADNLLDPAFDKFGEDISDTLRYMNLNGATGSSDGTALNRLEQIVIYYFTLLSDPSGSKNRDMKFISRILYDVLIGPVESVIADKSTLVIVPDGILEYFPFETLTDKDGKYLIEKYNVKYTHSATVRNFLIDRVYIDEQQPLLAIGAAVYNESKYKKEMDPKKRIKYKTLEKMNRKRRMNRFSGFVWENAPDMAEEIRRISKGVNNSKTFTGYEATEGKVKEIFSNASFAGFKTVHLSAHVYNDLNEPEKSALVLSQASGAGADDGLLNLHEIINLNMKSELVSISGNNVVLDPSSGGAGIAGLVHSFFLAGANGVAISQWHVSDSVTGKFFAHLYKQAAKDGVDYSEALTETKRFFIKGKFGRKYNNPYYWAPVVYYGK